MYYLVTRAMGEDDRRKFDDSLLSRPGEPPRPPSWWKGEEDAAKGNMAALAMLRQTAGRG